MSFYGNITNTARTHFQFDRIYPNRQEMESNKTQDGIYTGRFILIEYDSVHLDSFLRVQVKTNDDGIIEFYSNPRGDGEQQTLLTKGNTPNGTVVYTSELEDTPQNGYYAKDCVFYICTSAPNSGNSNEPATFELIDETVKLNYTNNYNIDKEAYGRGYDSTVWQKIYSNGQEKYILIAELNTVVPTFDVAADAPTQSPVVPHFDVNSSDIYYKLHWQTPWGMRVKSANIESGPEFTEDGEIIGGSNIPYTTSYPVEGIKSDETTIWSREEYDSRTGEITKLYWHPVDSQWKIEPPDSSSQIPAAIYYNRAGFSYQNISLDNSEDCITIESTGQSGHRYSDHNNLNGETFSQPDIQELSIMLPSIGTSIAEMWNVVYGDAQQNGGLVRNTDINWDSTNGLRMVKEDKEKHGFTYEPEQVSTLAGAINSVHDLMGMIIIDSSDKAMSDDFASTADETKIYYSEGKYYRKAIKYDYVDVANGDDENNNIIPEDAGYIEINTFEDFPANTYYYGTQNVVYKLETNNYPTYGRQYFTPKFNYLNVTDEMNPSLFTPVQNMSNYDKIIYYRVDDKGNYVNNDENPIIGETYYQIERNPLVGRPYLPNKYYIYTEKNADGSIKSGVKIPTDITAEELLENIDLCEEETFNPEYFYYTIGIYEEGEVRFNTIILFEPDLTSHYYWEESTGHYILLKNNPEILKNNNAFFYTIREMFNTQHFYVPNKYFIANDDLTEFTIYSNEIPDLTLTFYWKAEDTEVILKNRYYVSHTYYYQLENRKFIIDESLTPVKDRQYYTRGVTLYVSKDINELFGIGAEWNTNVTVVPPGVAVAERIAGSTMKELEGFSRTLNTIHGLILEINNLLLINDARTRDLKTVQGSINVLNDIINKFEIIAPGHIFIVDEYGRVHSSSYTTKQIFTAHNYGNNEDIEIEASEDRWINMEIDTNVIEPKIIIKHNFTEIDNPVTETTSTHDEDNSSGQIKLYTPIVDTMGHIVGNNTETVELPHNFKTISINGTSLVADNHIANMNIVNGNRWINLIANPETDTLTIEHAPAGGDITTSYNTNDILIFGDDFNVPTISYDNLGHITEIVDHTVTIPSLTIDKGTTGNVITGLTLDTSTNDSRFTLNASYVGTLPITGYTADNLSASTILDTDTINSALGKLQLQIIDTNNNLTNEILDRQNLGITVENLQEQLEALQLTLNNLTNVVIPDLDTRIKALER